jgi:uncharacterized protein (TIGR04255 family)
MASMERPLPDFDDPPVIETYLGVEFLPLGKWAVPHFGLYWNEIRGEYPRFELQPPLASQIETFGKETRQPQMVTLELLAQPPTRCWFIDKSGSRLIQVQNDRFIHNWRKMGPTDTYPHYENIRPVFEREWNRFCDFLKANEIGSPEVRQCEVSYINHLDQGQGWQKFADLQEVVPSWSGVFSEGFLPAPEAIDVTTRFLLPNNQGRLHIHVQPAIRHADAKEVLQLTLTARGRPASADFADVLKWLDLGREWIVRGFADITTTKMHKLWKRRKGT